MVKWGKCKKHSIYYVNKQIMQMALNKAHSKKLKSIDSEYQRIKTKLLKEKNTTSEIDDIHVFNKNKSNQIKWKKIRNSYKGDERRKWEDQKAQLEAGISSVASLVYLQKIIKDPTSVFYHKCDTCKKCQESLIFDHIQYNNICPRCHEVTNVLIASEDLSTDIMIFKAQTEMNISSTNITKKNTSKNRVPLYKRYLQQFSNHMPEIPKEVFATIYLNLSSVHILSSARARHAPISSILRNNGMTQYIHQSMRITKLFNGQKVPNISDALMDRLLTRFEIICRVYTGYKLTFEMVTYVLLKMENENTLAECFSLPSSKNVLKKSYNKLVRIVDECKILEPDLSWELESLI